MAKGKGGARLVEWPDEAYSPPGGEDFVGPVTLGWEGIPTDGNGYYDHNLLPEGMNDRMEFNYYDAMRGEASGAIDYYGDDGYNGINGVLRGVVGYEDSARIRGYIGALDSLMTTRVPVNTVVYRGISTGGWSRGLISGIKSGRVKMIEDPGFVSTALSKRGAFGGNITLKIRVPAGSRAIWTMGHDRRRFISLEKEMLLPRGSRFRVIRATTTGTGKGIRHSIEVELIQ